VTQKYDLQAAISPPAVQQGIWLHWKALELSARQMMLGVRQLGCIKALQGRKLILDGLPHGQQETLHHHSCVQADKLAACKRDNFV